MSHHKQRPVSTLTVPRYQGVGILRELYPVHHTTQKLITCRAGLFMCHHQAGTAVDARVAGSELGCRLHPSLPLSQGAAQML